MTGTPHPLMPVTVDQVTERVARVAERWAIMHAEADALAALEAERRRPVGDPDE